MHGSVGMTLLLKGAHLAVQREVMVLCGLDEFLSSVKCL